MIRCNLMVSPIWSLDRGIAPFFVTQCNYRCWFCVRKALFTRYQEKEIIFKRWPPGFDEIGSMAWIILTFTMARLVERHELHLERTSHTLDVNGLTIQLQWITCFLTDARWSFSTWTEGWCQGERRKLFGCTLRRNRWSKRPRTGT